MTAETKPLRVVEYAEAKASPELVELAIASGEYSRFRLDPRLNDERFVAMYRHWIDRSVARELADAVLVAECGDAPGPNRTVIGRNGLSIRVPLSRVDRAGRRGGHRARTGRRCDVDPEAHPSGCVAAAHIKLALLLRWSMHRPVGSTGATGYRLSQVRNIYHFWLQAGRPNADAATRRAA